MMSNKEKEKAQAQPKKINMEEFFHSPTAIDPEWINKILSFNFEIREYVDIHSELQIMDNEAYIPIIGPISTYIDLFSSLFGWPSVEALISQWKQAEAADVDRINLIIDSPGGQVGGT